MERVQQRVEHGDVQEPLREAIQRVVQDVGHQVPLLRPRTQIWRLCGEFH